METFVKWPHLHFHYEKIHVYRPKILFNKASTRFFIFKFVHGIGTNYSGGLLKP